MTTGLDASRFAKVRTLHDRTDIPGEKAAAADRMAEPDPTTSTCIPPAFAGADDGTDVIGSAYENDVIG